MRKLWLGLAAPALVALWISLVDADTPSTKPPAGLRTTETNVHALVGARLVIAPGKVVPKGTLVIRDGVIIAAGADHSAGRRQGLGRQRQDHLCGLHRRL